MCRKRSLVWMISDQNLFLTMNFYFSDKNPPNEKLSKHITVQRAHTWSWGVWLVCGRDLWSGWFVSVTCHRMVPKGTPRWGHHRAIWRQNQKQLPICNSVLNTVYISELSFSKGVMYDKRLKMKRDARLKAVNFPRKRLLSVRNLSSYSGVCRTLRL